jgi:hypothetical protein
MSKIKIEANNTYIFQKRCTNIVLKGKVLEETKTTYLIEWENGNKVRYLIEDFDYDFTQIEKIEENE